MSFIIALYVGDGLVFASDSRITYNITSQNEDGSKTIECGVRFSDTSPKTFLTPSNVGISCCGDSCIQNKPITGYIERFIEEHKDNDVDDIKDAIAPYFHALNETLNTTFLVGGYKEEEGVLKQKLYGINTKTQEVTTYDTSLQGATWSGQTDIMTRILNPVFNRTSDGNFQEIVSYPILWQFFTLQDAIDFARYAVRTTIETMQFQSRAKSVGGPIDILVIKPTESIWIEKRKLQ